MPTHSLAETRSLLLREKEKSQYYWYMLSFMRTKIELTILTKSSY